MTWSEELDHFRCLHFYPGTDMDANRLNLMRAESLQEMIREEFTAMVDKLSDGEVIDFDILSSLGREIWLVRAIHAHLVSELDVAMR